MTETAVLSRAGLNELIDALIADGYRVVGPTVRDEAIVLAELDSGAQLPSGGGVDSAPGRYRLRRRADEAVFGHSAGAQSWKQFLHPPRQPLWSADGDGFSAAREEPVRYAFIGVRVCDLAAIATLGTVLGWGAQGRLVRPAAEGLVRGRGGLHGARRGVFLRVDGTGPEPVPAMTSRSPSASTTKGTGFVVDIGSPEDGRSALAGDRCAGVRRGSTHRRVDARRQVPAAPAGREAHDQPGCAFMGTIVHQGTALGVVVRTGEHGVRADSRGPGRKAQPDRL
jgi:hypothetical protein